MLKTILVPLDGSYQAERALPYALALARAGKGRLVLFHGASESRRDAQTMHELGDLAGKVRGSDVSVETVERDVPDFASDGEIAQVVARVADEEQVDLIVMATHAVWSVERWLCGSVADQLLHRATVPCS